MAIAIKYNLLKTTIARPLIVSSELALEICPHSILAQVNLTRKEYPVLHAYWTGLTVQITHPDNHTYRKNSKVIPAPEPVIFKLNPDAPEYVPKTKIRTVIKLKKKTV